MKMKSTRLILMITVALFCRESGTTVGTETDRAKRSDDVPALETVVTALSQHLAEVTSELRALKTLFNAVEAKFNASQMNVAFHVYHSADPFNVASQGTVVYNTAITNIGQAYDVRSGFFTAPVSGTYAFFTTCIAVANTSEEVYLIVEDAIVTICYSWSPNTSPDEQGAAQAVVHMRAGQKAWVQLREDSQNVRGDRLNTFSGFLVRPEL